MSEEKLITEYMVRNNIPVEVCIYAPFTGVIYASTLTLDRDRVNKEVMNIIAGKPYELKYTQI